MTAKNRRELKQLFRTGAQPTEQDYADVLDSALNQRDDGMSKPPEPYLPMRIKGNGAGLHVLDLYDDDTHNWRISLMSGADSGYNIADPSGSSHFFIEDGSGNVGLGVSKPKAKLHINQSASQGDSICIQDAAGDITPTRVSNAGHLYVNSLKDGEDGIAMSDASAYVNGSLHIVDESASKSWLHVNQYGAVGINAEAEGNVPKVHVNTDVDITGDFNIGNSQTVTGISNTVGSGTSNETLLTENAIHNAMHEMLPKGSIVMWSNNQIPQGWAICDGNTGTPNLTDKFIRAANSATLNKSGGADSATLSEANLPAHTHHITLKEVPDHSHSIDFQRDDKNVGNVGMGFVLYSGWSGHEISSTEGGGRHTPEINTVSSFGKANPTAISLIPAHYALYYIMKVTGPEPVY